MGNKRIDKYITIRDEIQLGLTTIEKNDIRYDKLNEILANCEKQINTYNSIVNALNRKMQMKIENKSTYQLESVGINKLIRKLEKQLDPKLLKELKTIYNINDLTDEFDPSVVEFLNSAKYIEYKRNNELLDSKYLAENKQEEKKEDVELVIDADAFIEKFNANNRKTDINNYFKQEVSKGNVQKELNLATGKKHNLSKPTLVKESKKMRKERLKNSYKLIYGGLTLLAISMSPFINSFAISTLLAMSSFPIVGTGVILKNKDKIENYKKYNQEIDKLYGLYNLNEANLKFCEEINALLKLIEDEKKLTGFHKKQLLSKIKKIAKRVNTETREEKEEFQKLNNIYDETIANINNNENFYIRFKTIRNYYEFANDNIYLTKEEKEQLLKKVDFIAKHFNYNPVSLEVIEGFGERISGITSKIDWYYMTKEPIDNKDAISIQSEIVEVNKKISINKFIPLLEKLHLIDRLAENDKKLKNIINNTRVEGRKIS